MGGGAAHIAALRGLADLQGLDRAGQPALCVQRRAQPTAWLDDPAERARLGRIGPARGAGAGGLPPAAGGHFAPPPPPFPTPEAGGAAVGRGAATRPPAVPVLPWRAGRRAASQ